METNHVQGVLRWVEGAKLAHAKALEALGITDDMLRKQDIRTVSTPRVLSGTTTHAETNTEDTSTMELRQHVAGNGAEGHTHRQPDPPKPQWKDLPLAQRQAYALVYFTLDDWLSDKGLDIGVEVRQNAILWSRWIADIRMKAKTKVNVFHYEKAVEQRMQDLGIARKLTKPHKSEPSDPRDPTDWQVGLLRTASGIPQQTVNNLARAFHHVQPEGWYDLVRERHMLGAKPVEDGDDTAYGILIEQQTRMRVTNIKLVGRAMDHVCRQNPRDLLQEWLETLPEVPVTDLLTTWLRTYAHVPDTVSNGYVSDVSRILPVGMVARILRPGCQFRYVVTLEGEENAGKSELVNILAGEDPYGCSWYVPLSGSLEGKEAHMMLQGALLAELADFSSYNKTGENRMKALVTERTDSFVPKFSNKRVDHLRRTIFVATVNPEGDGTYLKGQTGNTRYLPIRVQAIDLEGFGAIRTQLIAEAKTYYLAHPTDWWKLESEEDARNAREERRQKSIYEDDLGSWLESHEYLVVWWELLAEKYLELPRNQWTDRRTQMELTKALSALQWRKGKQARTPDGGRVVPWSQCDEERTLMLLKEYFQNLQGSNIRVGSMPREIAR
jgi:hypothetical protein